MTFILKLIIFKNYILISFKVFSLLFLYLSCKIINLILVLNNF
jgi:hypothetical protein